MKQELLWVNKKAPLEALAFKGAFLCKKRQAFFEL